MHVSLDQLGDAVQFQAHNESGYDFTIASTDEMEGVSPMEMIALGVGGCSSIDILSILDKQRQAVDDFTVNVEGERATDEVPAVFRSLEVHYQVEGDVDPEKVQRAIELSLDKYCSVSHMLQASVPISYRYTVNGTEYDGGTRPPAE